MSHKVYAVRFTLEGLELPTWNAHVETPHKVDIRKFSEVYVTANKFRVQLIRRKQSERKMI